MVEELPPAEQAAISWSHPSYSLTGGDEVDTGQGVDATKEYSAFMCYKYTTISTLLVNLRETTDC